MDWIGLFPEFVFNCTIATAMGKVTRSQRRIDFVLKRKIDEISEIEEDPTAATSDHFPFLELEQQQHSHCNEHSNEPVIFRGIEFL